MKHTIARRATPAAALALAVGLALTGCGSDEVDTAAASPSPTMSMSMPAMPTGASATEGVYELTGFWVKESSLDMSGGFGTIANTGDTDDELVGATAPGVPMIELHETVDGVMRQVQSSPVPAGGTLVLAPGANHLMLMGLTEPLKVGGTLEITLQFASGGTATIAAPIEPFTADDGHGDS